MEGLGEVRDEGATSSVGCGHRSLGPGKQTKRADMMQCTKSPQGENTGDSQGSAKEEPSMKAGGAAILLHLGSPRAEDSGASQASESGALTKPSSSSSKCGQEKSLTGTTRSTERAVETGTMRVLGHSRSAETSRTSSSDTTRCAAPPSWSMVPGQHKLWNSETSASSRSSSVVLHRILGQPTSSSGSSSGDLAPSIGETMPETTSAQAIAHELWASDSSSSDRGSSLSNESPALDEQGVGAKGEARAKRSASASANAGRGAGLGCLIAVPIAAAVGLAHFFENFAYIRHLHNVGDQGLAQAAALQTENAFYYSYYNELVEAESLAGGLEGIVWDRRSEYPDVLNALRRFNIYQEVVMAMAYRALRSCGLDVLDAWDFFRYTILALNGAGHAALSMLASEVSGNPLAGIACFLVSFLNRFQISRLGNYSTSNLREIWGIPVLWMQTLCLWWLLLGTRRCRRLLWFSFGLLTFVFIVVWQFSPFLLLLQATAVYFVSLVCGYRAVRPVVTGIIDTYLVTTALAVAVHFGSPYLLTSPFLCQILALRIAMFVSASVCGPCRRGKGGVCAWLLERICDVCEGLVAVAGFLLIRKAMEPFATADTHVYEILCTKVAAVNELLPTSLQLPEHRLPDCAEPSFNARLYLIMGVFNLIEAQSLNTYRSTSAGQAALLACALVVLRCALGQLLGRSCAAAQAPLVPAASPAAQDAPAAEKKSGSSGDAGSSLRRRKGSAPASTPAPAPAPAARKEKDGKDKSPNALVDSGDEEREEAALLFFVVQSVLFFLLGCLVNRLRVAFGPPMMVLAASIFGPRLFPIRALLRRHYVLVAGVLLVAHCAHVAWMATLLPCVNGNEGVCEHLNDT